MVKWLDGFIWSAAVLLLLSGLDIVTQRQSSPLLLADMVVLVGGLATFFALTRRLATRRVRRPHAR